MVQDPGRCDDDIGNIPGAIFGPDMPAPIRITAACYLGVEADVVAKLVLVVFITLFQADARKNTRHTGANYYVAQLFVRNCCLFDCHVMPLGISYRASHWTARFYGARPRQAEA